MKLIAKVGMVVALFSSALARGEVDWPPKKTKEWRDFQKLVRAVDRDDVAAVRTMVRHGTDVDGKKAGDDFVPMERPLLRASRKGNLTIVNILLKAGAKPDWCCCSCVTALHEAIRKRHSKVVRRLLEAGSDPKIPYDGTTSSIDLANQTGNAEIIELVSKRVSGS